jgi:hypothetical protein
MHCVNSSIFFSAFLRCSALSQSTKRRLLEWKVWNDITMYISRGCPSLIPSEITNYTPKENSGWDGVIQRVNNFEDDGHACKLVRALAHGEQVCKGHGGEGFKVRGDLWRKLGHMAIDSVEAGEPHWVRSCGFDQAWEKIPMREGEGTKL